MNFGQRLSNGFSLVERSVALPLKYPKIFLYTFLTILVGSIHLLVVSWMVPSVIGGIVELTKFGGVTKLADLTNDAVLQAKLNLLDLVLSPFIIFASYFFMYAGYKYILGTFNGKSLSFANSCQFPLGRFLVLVITEVLVGHAINLISQPYAGALTVVFHLVLGFAAIFYLFDGYSFGGAIQWAMRFMGRAIVELLFFYIGWSLMILAVSTVFLILIPLITSIITSASMWTPEFVELLRGLWHAYTAILIAVGTLVGGTLVAAMSIGIIPLLYRYLSNDRTFPCK